ncbi:MAG TPA: hypothetical protein VGO43_04765 [Pyrinomonadaceae bacterium]|jgi:hypothetical protein|nr:hypothetical protein [Pyrinomonadaceae bacterium]
MAQETELWEQETSTQTDRTEERKPMESETGRDMPSGDGDVGDEQVNAISDDGSGRPTGQDHSTEHHEAQQPTDGVGAVQDDNLVGTDIADLPDNE